MGLLVAQIVIELIDGVRSSLIALGKKGRLASGRLSLLSSEYRLLSWEMTLITILIPPFVQIHDGNQYRKGSNTND